MESHGNSACPDQQGRHPSPALPKDHRYEVVALVLQGGGALGAYQAGVYEGLAAANLHPNWVAGISIGALNAAVIAGNSPKNRVDRLNALWDTICRPPWLPSTPGSHLDPTHVPESLIGLMNGWEAWRALTEGQNGFFVPRSPSEWLLPTQPGHASFYDTRPLKSTLEALIDFDRLNDARQMRVSVGAVNVHTGNMVYFDNTRETLRAEHFMASGALPPGFPAVEIDGEFYWDGGLVSNTPLQEVMDAVPRKNALIFQVDLWSAHGPVPNDLAQVATRQKDIQYSSRTRMITDTMDRAQRYRRLLLELMALVPENQRDDTAFKRAQALACDRFYNVIHLIYADKHCESHYKDYQFGAPTMRAHWQSGLADIQHSLARPGWLDMPTADKPFITHDVHRR